MRRNDQPAAAGADEAALPPAQSLALIEQQSARTRERTDVNAALICAAWGVAWLLGFGFFYLGSGAGAVLEVPLWVVGLVFAGLLVSALVVQTVHMIRATSGVHGVSAESGARYGWTWAVGMSALSILLSAASSQGMSDEAVALLWPAAFCLLVGVLLMAGGAIWRDRVQYGLGAWIATVDVAGALVGLPGYYLVMSLAGGGGLLLAALLHTAHRTRPLARA